MIFSDKEFSEIEKLFDESLSYSKKDALLLAINKAVEIKFTPEFIRFACVSAVASCTCGTKTPVSEFHKESCTYRVITTMVKIIEPDLE